MADKQTQADRQDAFNQQTLKELAKRVVIGPTEPGKAYLALLHGRKNPQADMDTWGENGPFIGPLKACHITYLSSINLIFEDGYETGPLFDRDGLGFHRDLLYYDGVYYGDWEIQIAE